MKQIVFLFPALILLGSFGCKKNTGITDPVTKATQKILLRSIVTTSTTTKDSLTYQYDASYHLIDYTNSALKDETKITYDASDRVTEVNTYRNSVIYYKSVYTYTSNTVTRNTTYYTNGSASSTLQVVYTLDVNQRIVKQDNGNGTIDNYTYTNGNMSTDNSYRNTDLTTPYHTEADTYDNQKNYLINATGNFDLVLGTTAKNKNNVVQAITTATGQTTITTTATFGYNTDGYPITRTLNSTSANSTTNTYNYIFK